MKTIFFSISNGGIARNYASFSGSVLDLLCQKDDIRVVVLVRRKETVPERFRNSNKCIIEEIEESLKKNVVQKLFYFFFSFLIFTDTTGLVSSYGVRADKPRSLVGFWNYPIKVFVAKVFGRSQWVKKTFVPTVYLKLFRERPYKRLFDTYKPNMVFLPNVCAWPNDLHLLIEAKRQEVTTVGMHGSWDHFSKYFAPFQPDRLLVWSEPVKYEAVYFQGYNPLNVEVVGGPHVDFFVDTENIEPRPRFLKRLGFPDDAIIILYASQGPYSLDGADLVEMILRWIEDGNLDSRTRIIIRPHPSGILEKEKYEHFRGNSLIYFGVADNWQSIGGFKHYVNVLYHADVVVTTYSTVGPDGVLMDRPVIIAGFDGYKRRPMYQSVRRHKQFTHYQMISKIGGIRIVERREDFLRTIKDCLTNPKRDAVERSILREKVFGFTDGRNSSRIIDRITHALS